MFFSRNLPCVPVITFISGSSAQEQLPVAVPLGYAQGPVPVMSVVRVKSNAMRLLPTVIKAVTKDSYRPGWFPVMRLVQTGGVVMKANRPMGAADV